MNEVFEVPNNGFLSQNPANAAQNSANIDMLLKLDMPIKGQPFTVPIARPIFIDRRNTKLIGFTFQATAPRCAVVVRAENCVLEGIRNVGLPGQTRTGAVAYDSGFVFEPGAKGTYVEACESVQHAAGGFLNFGSTHLYMTHCKSIDTGADGVHHTYGAGWAEVHHHTCIRTGDDYYAVVSHANEPLTHDILVKNSEGYGQKWGRGATVIGGERVRYENLLLHQCSGFGININSEESYNTHGVSDVRLEGITINGTGVGQPRPADWVGVLVGGRAAGWVKNVSTKNIIVRNSGGAVSRHDATFTKNIDLSGILE